MMDAMDVLPASSLLAAEVNMYSRIYHSSESEGETEHSIA